MSKPTDEHQATPNRAEPRLQFERFELAAVLSRFDTGVIESISEFPRGSADSPKVVISCERGMFILNRRGPGRDEPERVAFAHSLQLHLARAGFPAPRLLGDRRDQNSTVRVNGRAYELFEFIHGEPSDHSPAAAEAAGRELGLFHRLAAQHESNWSPPEGAYHDDPNAIRRLESLQDRLEGDAAARLAAACAEAARRVDDAGLPDWPRQVIHGDWHPGNMLFRGHEVVGVVDFDSARIGPRVLDVANAALQ
ncbi:MAG: phosphotransferase, partial [Planctomycetota bacterium]|nr:phosphotransferase [Planctomycetota bacterium]